MLKKIITITFIIISVVMLDSLTFEEAKNIVVNDILKNDIEFVNVYGKTSTTFREDGLDLHHGQNIASFFNSSFYFFVDDYPGAKWYHPVRYIELDSQSGDFHITNGNIYPANNYTDFEIVSATETTSHVTNTTTTPSNLPTVSTLNENSNLYAVIIGTDEVGVNLALWDDDMCFWNDVVGMYCMLTEHGYTKENIFVHYSLGEGPEGNQDLDDPDDESNDID